MLCSASSFIVPSTISAVLVVSLGWILKKWLGTKVEAFYTQRVESSIATIKKDNDASLIAFRDQLENQTQLYSSAFTSFASGQRASMERRLDAADILWKDVLLFRSALPSAFAYMDILTVDEFLKARQTPRGQELFAELSEDKVLSFITSQGLDATIGREIDSSIERVRPYIDEYLWSLFLTYKKIMIRIWLQLVWSKEDSTKIYWYKDNNTKQLIEVVLTRDELDDFNRARFGKISNVRIKLEAKIVNELRRMISGEVSGSDSLEQVKKYQQVAGQELGSYIADHSSSVTP